MSAPKLWGPLTNNAPVGYGKVEALSGVDTPYLTAAGPGFVANKKNTTSQVITSDPDDPPTLRVWVLTGGLIDGPSFVSDTEVTETYAPSGRVRKYPFPTPHRDFYSYVAMVAPERVAVLGGTPGGVGVMLFNTSWRAGGWEIAPANTSPAISKIVQLPSFPETVREIIDESFLGSPVATGADSEGRYRYAVLRKRVMAWGDFEYPTLAGHDPPDGFSDLRERISDFVFSWGSADPAALTHDFTPTQFIGRQCSSSDLFCTGPGKLARIVVPQASIRTYKRLETHPTETTYDINGDVIPWTWWVAVFHNIFDVVDPILVTSEDHGESWTSRPLTDLLGYLEASKKHRPSEYEVELNFTGLYVISFDGSYHEAEWTSRIGNLHESVFHYMGAGKTLVFAGYGADSAETFVSTGYRVSNEFPAIRQEDLVKFFIFDGGGFSEIPCPLSGRAFYQARLAVQNAVCFGTGCLAIIDDQQIHSTRDFGQNWTTTTIEQLLCYAPYNVVYHIGVDVITPYKSPEDLGRIMLLAYTYRGMRLAFYDGNMNYKGSRRTAIRAPADGLTRSANALFNVDRRNRPLHIGLPDEFNPPPPPPPPPP